MIAALAVEAAAAGFVVGGEGLIGPRFAPCGSLPPAIIHDASGRCLALPNSPDYDQLRRFLDRYERNYGQRFAPDKPVLEWPILRREVPPTPEAHIQPRYRAASQVRPEFEQAGRRLDARPRIGDQ